MGIKKYLTGEMNLDVSPELIKPEDYTLGRNVVKGRSISGEAGTTEPIRGTSSIDIASETDSGDLCIGMCPSRNQTKLYIFFYNATAANNKIVEYDVANTTKKTVLQGSILNFGQYDSILNAKEINDHLYFTDGVNEARCVSTTAWASDTPKEEDISIGKRPFPFDPKWQKFEDAAVNGESLPDLLSGYDFQFAAQYMYGDNKRSVISPISTLAASNLPDEKFKRIRVYLGIDALEVASTVTDGTTGYVTSGFDNADGSLPIQENVPQTVESINICVRIGNFGTWNVVDNIKRDGSGDFERNWYDFKNNTNGVVLEDRYNLPFDLIPRRPLAQELAANKMFYGNFYEGYDTPDVELTAAYSETDFSGGGGTITIETQVYEQLFQLYRQTSNAGAAQGCPAGEGQVHEPIGESIRYLINNGGTFEYLDSTGFENSLGSAVTMNYRYTAGQARIYFTGTYSLAGVAAGDYIHSGSTNMGGTNYESTSGGCTSVGLPYSCKVLSVNAGSGYIVIDPSSNSGFWDNSSAYTLLISASSTAYYFTPQDILDDTLAETSGDTYFTLTSSNCFSCHPQNTMFRMGYQNAGTYSWGVTSALGTISVEVAATKSDFDGIKSFSSNSSYRLGIVYKDGFGRAAGVATGPNSVVDIVGTKYIFNAKIQWSIDPSEDVNIPSWAEYYSIVRTKNLRKTSFLEYHTADIYYQAIKTDGTWDTATYTYDPDNGRAVIDIATLLATGKGYSFSEGDRIILFNVNYNDTGAVESDVTLDIPIQDLEDGTKIILSNRDLLAGDATAEDGGKPLLQYQAIRFEIYNPAEDTFDSVFYEVGETYKIDDSGGLSHEAYSGELDGDTINVLRNKYIRNATGLIVVDPATDASPDLYRSMTAQDDNSAALWNTNVGHAFAIDEIGEVFKDQYFRWSNQFIQDTKVNGLNEFEPLNEKAIPLENGPIQALRLTSKVQGEGTVMLSINKLNPASIYLDENQWTDNVGNETSAITFEDVGTIRSQTNEHGCLNPESVYAYKGKVYWYDDSKGHFVRYTRNGAQTLSEQRVSTHFADITKSASNKVITFHDPFNKLILSTAYLHGISANRTIGFDRFYDQWRSYYDFQPDWGLDMNDVLYTVKGQGLWEHNDSAATYMNFYSTQYGLKIEMSFNEDSQAPKDWRACQIQVSSNLVDFSTAPPVIDVASATDFIVEFENKNGQESDLQATDFDIDDFILYSDILFDTNSSGGLMEGDQMASNTLRMKVTVNLAELFQLYFFELGFIPSLGHQI